MDATLVERKDGLVTVTLNRPERKNALNAANWADLSAVLTEVTNDPEDRALLLTGAGGNFSSGADLAAKGGETSSLTGRPNQPIVVEMRVVGDIINRLHRLPKPSVAAVDGVVVGVGLGLALACDLVVASDRARFSSIFVRRGLALDGGTSWSLPRHVGLRRAKQMAMLGEWITAEQALDWGLINEVVPADELEKTATGLGHRLASGPTISLSLIKRLLDASELLTFEQAVEEEARAQHIAYTTQDVREGFQAFAERREPRFTGK